jgi:glutamate formiminotransferase
MSQVVQCVPNFSEGRRLDVVERIVEPLRNQVGFQLVSVEPDADYNRTVVTLIGDPRAITDALLPFVGNVLEEIDMNHQSGEHPRMGAVDVIPFIPIQGITMEECVAYANELGRRIYDTYQIPSFLYAEAATSKQRKNLPDIRKGEFEGMKEKIQDPKWTPDFGTNAIHPTFGVIGIGARIPLIAYNIDLATSDLKPAKAIAKAIRHSSGGFRYIQAGPVYLDSRHHVQVTMNILDYTKNPIYRILETVKMEARRFGVEVPSCELVGLAPAKALLDSLAYYFAVEGRPFDKTMSIDDIVQYSTTTMGFRDLAADKIIESHIQ